MMTLDPREVALLLALEADLTFGVAPESRLIVENLISSGYVSRDRSQGNPRQFAHDGGRDSASRYGLKLTPEGHNIAQLAQNALVELGILDRNGMRQPAAVRDGTSRRRLR